MHKKFLRPLATLLLAIALPCLTKAAQPPEPWSWQDVGEVVHHGSVDLKDDVFKINGSGAEIWETSDSFYLVSQPLKGNGSIVAHFKDGLNFVDPFAKAGIMVRSSIEPNAANAFIAVTSQNGAIFQQRATEGGSTTSKLMEGKFSSAVGGSGLWLKLEFADGVIAGFTSDDGKDWQMLGEAKFEFSEKTVVGLAMTSHDANQQYGFATFDNVVVEMSPAN